MAVSAREVYENLAWGWVKSVEDPLREIDEDKVISAYRMNFPVHRPGSNSCKKNCRFNPKCYNGLGEARWINMEEMSSDEDIEEEEEYILMERRALGFPAGLKNLGNTCYVNSFLQIWFHNLKFRQAMYEWDPEFDEEEKKTEGSKKSSDQSSSQSHCNNSVYKPKGKVASLQALFSMMEFTNRRAVDPNDFIAKLGLDPQVQQDAQEFSKLFISLLESALSSQKNPLVKNLVQSQFRGEYAYVTTCLKCKRESKRPSFFYELDLTLQGHKTLGQCLNDYTKKEKLEGDNQYSCGFCESKQDATRCVRLLDLPPVLNLQLNRFIFDMQSGRKKKLNSAVQFPEKLDMSEFIGKKAGSKVYVLTGVLMHVGAEANHGHYIAHIQDPRSDHWYKFSDQIVERIHARNSNVTLGDEENPLKAQKSQAAQKQNSSSTLTQRGIQSSNSAYMLVYTEVNSFESIRKEEEKRQRQKRLVSDRSMRIIRRKNIRFERQRKRHIRRRRMIMVERAMEAQRLAIIHQQQKQKKLQEEKENSEREDSQNETEEKPKSEVNEEQGSTEVKNGPKDEVKKETSDSKKVKVEFKTESNGPSAESENKTEVDSEVKAAKVKATRVKRESESKESETKTAKVKTESETKESKVKTESETKESKVKAESETKESKFKVESEPKSTKVKAESEVKAAKVKAESSSDKEEESSMKKVKKSDPLVNGQKSEGEGKATSENGDEEERLEEERALKRAVLLAEMDEEAEEEEEYGAMFDSDMYEDTTEDEDEFFEDEDEEDSDLDLQDTEDEDIEPETVQAQLEYVYRNGLVFASVFPKQLIEYIERDRKLLDEEINEHMMLKRERLLQARRLRQNMLRFIGDMPYDEDLDPHGIDFEFIPIEWLVRYFECPQAASVIETSKELCVHGRLDLDRLIHVKVIDAECAERLYEEAGKGAGRRLSGDALCDICVRNRCRVLKLDESLGRDMKLLVEWMRPNNISPDDQMYWVSKNSLRRWRAIAKSNLDEEIVDEAHQYMEEMAARAEAACLGLEDEDSCEEEEEEEDEEEGEVDSESCESCDDHDHHGVETETDLSEEAEFDRFCNQMVSNELAKERERLKTSQKEASNAAKTSQKEASEQLKTSQKEASEQQLKTSHQKEHQLSEQLRRQQLLARVNGSRKRKSETSESENSPIVNGEATKKNCDKIDDETRDSPAKKSRLQQNGHSSTPTTSSDLNSKSNIKTSPTKNPVTNGSSVVTNGSPMTNGVSKSPESPVIRRKASEEEANIQQAKQKAAAAEIARRKAEEARRIEVLASTTFNGDIICRHGNLSPDESKRRLVPRRVWEKLKGYFNTTDFPKEQKSCAECRNDADATAMAHEKLKAAANLQKSSLIDIFHERNRPSWAKASLAKVYLISRRFVQEWRTFVRSPLNRDPIKEIGNRILLCRHDLLLYPLDLDTESDYESIVFMVSEEEWVHLKTFFKVDREISVVRNRAKIVKLQNGGSPVVKIQNGANSTAIITYNGGTTEEKSSPLDSILESNPRVCEECVSKRLEEEEQEKLRYSNVPIFVRLLNPGEHPDEPVAVNGSSNGQTNGSSGVNGIHDPDFDKVNGETASGIPPNKRSKIAAAENSLTNGNSSAFVRRSHRRQKVRGEHRIMVDSAMKLKDLKVKLMELFKIATYDQILTAPGSRILKENGKTLGELKVLPESLIHLRADDEPVDITEEYTGENGSKSVNGNSSENSAKTENSVKNGKVRLNGAPAISINPEEGFKGTGLLGGS